MSQNNEIFRCFFFLFSFIADTIGVGVRVQSLPTDRPRHYACTSSACKITTNVTEKTHVTVEDATGQDKSNTIIKSKLSAGNGFGWWPSYRTSPSKTTDVRRLPELFSNLTEITDYLSHVLDSLNQTTTDLKSTLTQIDKETNDVTRNWHLSYEIYYSPLQRNISLMFKRTSVQWRLLKNNSPNCNCLLLHMQHMWTEITGYVSYFLHTLDKKKIVLNSTLEVMKKGRELRKNWNGNVKLWNI